MLGVLVSVSWSGAYMLRIVAAMFAAAFPAFAVIVFAGILFFVFLFKLAFEE